MPEEINNNSKKTVFQKALQAFRKDGREETQAPMGHTPSIQNRDPYSPTNYGAKPPARNSVDALETRQQQFLDFQVQSIARDLYTRTIYFDTDRVAAYQDYRAMDHSPEIAAALNIMRDECLTRNERGNILDIFSENERIKQALKNLFHNKLNINYNLKLWIRELLKYGDHFVHLHIDGETRRGVYNVMALPAEEIHREDGIDGIMDNTRFRWDTKNMYFEEWQVAHFRLIEDTKRLPYGRSILDPARKLWKQLQLSEDAMLVYRLSRAPERRIFYIDVGNIDDADVSQYVQDMVTRVKRQPIVDSKTGQVSRKFNPAHVEEDYFIPIRGDKSSKIDTLPGAQNLGDIADIEYLQNKLFAAIQVPKPYMNYAESMPGGSMLSQADLRFARTINGIQESVLLELRRIANIHLLFMGFEDDLDNFTLTLTNPSTQQELLNLETWKARLEVFKEMFTTEAISPTSYTWAMEHILGFSKSEIKLLLRQQKIEKRLFTEIEEAAQVYDKIGLFKDLDDKFENPEKAAALEAGGGLEGDLGGEGGGGFGGGSALGGDTLGGIDAGGDLGGEGGDLGGEDLGGDLDAGGGEEAAPAEEPISEARDRLFKKLMSESEVRSESYLDELVGSEENKKKEVVEDKFESDFHRLNSKTVQLKESMKGLGKLIEKRKEAEILHEAQEIDEEILKEFSEANEELSTDEMIVEGSVSGSTFEDKLNESNEAVNQEAKNLQDEIEERIRNKKKND